MDMNAEHNKARAMVAAQNRATVHESPEDRDSRRAAEDWWADQHMQNADHYEAVATDHTLDPLTRQRAAQDSIREGLSGLRTMTFDHNGRRV